MEIKKYLVDFAQGRVSVPKFLEDCKEHPEILDFLTDIADDTFKTWVTHKTIDENGFPKYISEELPFDAKLSLEVELNQPLGTLAKHLNIHSFFSLVLVSAFPDDNITIDKTLDDKFNFMLDACPEYIEGVEIDCLIEEVLESLPENLSKTKRIKLFKEQIKKMFHVEGQKYPRWIQGGEWPMGQNNKPMRFVEQKRKKGKGYDNMLYTLFVFEDVETGEQRIIEQFT